MVFRFWYSICKDGSIKRIDLRPTLQLILGLLISLSIHFCQKFLDAPKDFLISCNEFTDEYKDKVTGVKRYIAKEKIKLRDFEGKNSFDLVWFRTEEEYTLAFKARKSVCLENDVAVSFHLLQGRVVTCASAHIANCESLMTVNFSGDSENDQKLDLIKSSEVVGISFENKREQYKLKITPDQALKFKQTIQCLNQN